jgi:two-component system NtrC family response regulator
MSSFSAAERRRDEPLDLLIVDDDLLSARLLKANLDRPGRTRVNLAGSGEEALERIAHARVDVVLTDLSMPEMDGIELIGRIRESDPTFPVIIMTANATLEKAVEGIRAGATDFLQKPVNVTAVQALAERAVKERPLRERSLRRRSGGRRLRPGSWSSAIIRGSTRCARLPSRSRARPMPASSSRESRGPARAWWPGSSTTCRTPAAASSK